MVDAGYADTAALNDLPVRGDWSLLADSPDVRVVIAIGVTPPRRRIADQIERNFGPRFVTLIHPRSWMGDRVRVGAGSVVCAGAYLTTEISVGEHSQIHVGSKVGHDASIGSFVTVAPGATVSGRVSIGDGTFIGAGAVILPDVAVGRWTIVGAGAIVTKDVPDNVTVVGVPARVIKRRQPDWQLAG